MKEKSAQEKNAAERQVSLITDALSKAAGNNGVWLNEEGKQYPRFYPKGAAVSPFNAMVLGLNSDKNGYATNLYTLFSEAKKRDEISPNIIPAPTDNPSEPALGNRHITNTATVAPINK
jgi:hypothetical protein